MSQNEVPSRTRLFSAARTLFSEQGYEKTSTSSIARAAGTSESQLIKHFGGKASLLEAIFADGWEAHRPWFDAKLSEINSAVDRLRAIPQLITEALHDDPELELLLLLEGRRIRKDGVSSIYVDGFHGAAELLLATLREMQAAGQLRDLVSPEAVTSALLGLTESALRDHLLAERAGRPEAFKVADIGKLTDALIDSVTVMRHAQSGG